MTTEEFNKLPKWAQFEVNKLENEVKELKSLLVAAEGINAGDGGLFFLNRVKGPLVQLPKYTYLTTKLRNGDTISLIHRETHLEVNEAFAVLPLSGNSLGITTRKMIQEVENNRFNTKR